VTSFVRNSAILAVVLFLPIVAHAQGIGGGGGGGLLAPMITWFMQNIALGVIIMALIGCGIAVMCGYRNVMVLAGIAVGSAIVGHAAEIGAAFFV
jgi:hypothetical protein